MTGRVRWPYEATEPLDSPLAVAIRRILPPPLLESSFDGRAPPVVSARL
jgi:hypothetical protein